MGRTSLEEPSVALERLSGRHAASVRTTTRLHRLRHTIDSLHELVMCVVGEQGLAPAGPLFARFHQVGGAIDIESGIPLAQPIEPSGVVLPSSLPGGPVLRCRYCGELEELAAIEDIIARHRRIHGLTAASAPWESYLVGRRDVINVADCITEVFLPVRSTIPQRRVPPDGPDRPGRMARLTRQAVR